MPTTEGYNSAKITLMDGYLMFVLVTSMLRMGTSICSVISQKPKTKLMRGIGNRVSESSHVENSLILRSVYQII